MAFTERTRMQERQKMVEQVLHQGTSISAAAKAAGVSRQTASLWVARGRECGLAQLSEKSRRPHTLRPGRVRGDRAASFANGRQTSGLGRQKAARRAVAA